MPEKIRQEDHSGVVGPSKPRLWKVLGPGLITGAADDDPSGIATYSQAGAQYGFQLAWTMLFTYPLMVVIQSISARIGRTTGLGIAGNMRLHYPPWLAQVIVLLLLVANTCNIGADLGAMAEVSQILLPNIHRVVYLMLYAGICAAGQIFLHHSRYVAVLKWLTLSLFSYFIVLCVAHVRWLEFARGPAIPTLYLNKDAWLMAVAILGMTISPYLFFWQASQEVEDTKEEPVREPLQRQPWQGRSALARIEVDTLVGMGVSNAVALAIMATTAATLHSQGAHELTSAAQAADALRPIAGNFAFGLFALGIIGTGLLSVPVLAGSAAYAIGEARGWPVGLSRQPRHAKAFYGTIAMALLMGASANTFSISPLKALVWSAVVNAIVAVPVMVILMRMSVNKTILGKFTVSTTMLVLGWIATAAMAVASCSFILSLLL